MIPGKLDLIVTLSAPTIEPGGTRAVVAASRPSFEADAYVGQLWSIDLADSEPPRRITRGVHDTAPSFSPDGVRLAFLRLDGDRRPQLAIRDARGGESRILTDAPLGVSAFVWSPDASRIAFVARRPEPLRYGVADGVSPGQEPPRRVTGNKYQMNGLGYVADQRAGIYVLELPPRAEEPWVEPVGRAALAAAAEKDPHEEARREFRLLGGRRGLPESLLITPADADATQPVFSPNGAHVYFVASLHETADDDLRTMVHRVAVPARNEKKLPEVAEPELVAGGPESDFAYDHPAFSQDGETLFMLGSWVGHGGLDFVAQGGGVFCQPAGTIGGEPAALTDRDAVDLSGPLVPHGKSSVLALASVRGAVELHAVNAAGNCRALVKGNREVIGAASNNGTLVVSFADSASPGELGVVERVNGTGVMRAISTFAAALGRETRVAAPQELTIPSKDGYPVHGWVFLPEGPGPHPVILNIHGGPYAQYGWGYFDEPQVYTEAGYAVVQCNPRGSAGYGREHGAAIQGCMGTLDMQDVLAFLKGALKANPSLDKKRLGIMGGSYGGYLTAWTIAHSKKFTAAIVERGYLDPWSFLGTSDIGWFFSPQYTGEEREAMDRQSPLAVADGVEIPTLVMHSEKDLRCPLEQAQRYHATLRRGGVEAEMLIFPGENHELSRSGTPWHRRERFEAILEWWNRHLPVDSGE